MDSKMMPRSIAVTLYTGETELRGHVKKIALGDFAKLATMIDDLMASGAKIGDLTSNDGSRALIEIMKTAPEKIADIVVLVSTFEKDQILSADMESIFELLTEAFALNNLVKMFSGAVKKAMGAQVAPTSEATEAQAHGLTEQSPA